MITSLDYGTTLAHSHRNGGLVNSYTHTALPNNSSANNHFSTLPHHLHHQPQTPQHNHQILITTAQHQLGTPMLLHQQPQPLSQTTPHVRFGTLPNRASSGNKPSPPPYPGNGLIPGGMLINTSATTGASIVQLPPPAQHSQPTTTTITSTGTGTGVAISTGALV